MVKKNHVISKNYILYLNDVHIHSGMWEHIKFRWGLLEETYNKTWVTFCLITSGFSAVSEACKINKKSISDLYQMWPYGKAVLEKYKFSKEQASFPELIWKCLVTIPCIAPIPH